MVTALVITGIILILGTIVFLEAGDVFIAKFRPGRTGPTEMPLPFLIVPLYGRDTAITPPPIGGGAQVPVEPPPPIAPIAPIPPVRVAAHSPITYQPVLADGDEAVVPDETVVFQRPLDEAVQILPGRLEVVSGEARCEDIRFVGTLAGEAELVVGREAGSPQRVVTLHSPTVSRRHARLRFTDGHWTITNLSATNPAVVNDETLPSHDTGTRVLADGDQIELGEVVLRFHAR